MMRHSTLVTGGSGFLGTPFVKKLVEQGRDVTVFDQRPCLVKGVRSLQGDVRDFSAVHDAIRDVDTVFHLASPVPQSTGSAHLYHDVIVEGTRHVLQAALDRGIHAVHVSSSGVYGANREGVLKETDEKRPLGPYGTAKWQAEQVCQEYARKGLHIVILRPMAIIGPGIYGVFKTFMHFVYKGYPLVTFGSGHNRIQLVSLSDMIKALLLAERYRRSGEALNLGSDMVPTVKEEFRALVAHAHSRSLIIPFPASLARLSCALLYQLGLSPLTPEHYAMLDKNSILDTAKAKELLGWVPQKDNITMMIEAYDWYARTRGGSTSP